MVYPYVWLTLYIKFTVRESQCVTIFNRIQRLIWLHLKKPICLIVSFQIVGIINMKFLCNIPDYCGECGGNNSSCQQVSGSYNMSQYGYSKVLRIAAGSSNIDIRQHGFRGSYKDDNYLGKYKIINLITV